MANFIHVVVEFVFSDRYFDLNLNAVIIKLHEEASHCWFARLSWSYV